MSNPDQSQTATLQTEVLRRLGRNLLVFQQIEGLLKFLLINHKTEGTQEDYQERQEEWAEAINRKTLGELVGKYLGKVLTDDRDEVLDDTDPDVVPYVSITRQFIVSSEFLEAMRRDLKFLTDERNELVHHFFPRWQPNSPEKMQDALDYLNAQRGKVLPILDHLTGLAASMQQNQRRIAEYLASDEYARLDELMWLQSSPLVTLLREVVGDIQRKDGWASLSRAGNLAHEQLPDDVKNLKERYGFSTLKKLLVACETFDIFDEPLPSGEVRTLFRVRPAN
jgi:hypothetical protein